MHIVIHTRVYTKKIMLQIRLTEIFIHFLKIHQLKVNIYFKTQLEVDRGRHIVDYHTIKSELWY